jgi:hypothetical protein
MLMIDIKIQRTRFEYQRKLQISIDVLPFRRNILVDPCFAENYHAYHNSDLT